MAIVASPGIRPQRAYSVTCTGSPYAQVEGTVSLADTHRGVGATGLLTSNPSVSCIHVSSMGVITSGGDFVEFGWDKDGSGIVECSGTGSDPHPYIFREDNKNGAERCFQGINVPSSDFGFEQLFTLNDGSVDSHFKAVFNGTVVGTSLTETFGVGNVVDNGERHSSADSSSANFAGLEYSNGAWQTWDNHHCFLDDDAVYSNDFLADSHDEIDTTSGSFECG